jgi:chlorobactene glucosyltransferase
MNIESALTAFAALTAAIASYILILTTTNASWLMWTNIVSPASSGEKISVLVPARNEAAGISACLDSLLAQKYRPYEIIVYDDDSTDGTGAILKSYVRKYPGMVQVIHGKNLEPGWYGKPQALQKLSEKANGAWLFFTDADTIHSPDSLGQAIALALHHDADLVSGYLQHTMKGFGETSVISSIYLLTMIVIPIWLIPSPRFFPISHAIGQCMCFRASAYKSVGGYAAVRNAVSEDVRIARLLKKAGKRVLFADLKDHVSCRMYEGYQNSIDGISKNVFDYLNKNVFLLLATTLAVPIFAFAPIVFSAWMPRHLAAAQAFFRFSVLVNLFSWVIVTLERRLPWYVPLISPLILCNALSAGWRACRAFSLGSTIEWKGRPVR